MQLLPSGGSLVLEVRGTAGQAVQAGEVLVVLESMKMKIDVRCSQEGTIQLFFREGLGRADPYLGAVGLTICLAVLCSRFHETWMRDGGMCLCGMLGAEVASLPEPGWRCTHRDHPLNRAPQSGCVSGYFMYSTRCRV